MRKAVKRNGLKTVISAFILLAGLSGCDKMKTMLRMGGGITDFRNAEIDVSGTPCSDNGKYSTLVLKDGKYELGNYQFELFGETKHGDVYGRTKKDAPDASVFVGDCAINGQTSQVLFVYGNDDGGKFKRLGDANLTDNGNGLVQSYDIADQQILVEQSEGNPPKLTKTTYALLNGKLTDLSPGASQLAEPGNSGTDAVSFQAFHDKLAPYGTWVDHPRWGRAWHPNQAGFKPYTNGHWKDDPATGTTWVSNDPWGGDPTHYGRWGYDPAYGGWLWVPGYTWGPGWVEWHQTGSKTGSEPMPPGETDDGSSTYVDTHERTGLHGSTSTHRSFGGFTHSYTIGHNNPGFSHGNGFSRGGSAGGGFSRSGGSGGFNHGGFGNSGGHSAPQMPHSGGGCSDGPQPTTAGPDDGVDTDNPPGAPRNTPQAGCGNSHHH